MSNCEYCGKEFEQPKYRTVKFCGKECQVAAYSAAKSITLSCRCCSKEFTVRKSESDRKYCSQDCYIKDMPTNPASIVQAANAVTKTCEHCKNEFTPLYNKKKAKFCSRECGNLDRRTLVPRNCDTCGKEYTSKKKDSRFCSRACYVVEGIPGRPAGPTVTFTCVGCGNPCTVPENYPSLKKYCSPLCARKERKYGWSKSGLLLEDTGVLIFRSNYELRFYAVCLRFKILIRSYDGPDIKTSLGNYRPDFIIGLDQEYIVEVKGWMDHESETKVKESQSQLDNFLLIDKSRLLEIELKGFKC